jgi:hypothetical protein
MTRLAAVCRQFVRRSPFPVHSDNVRHGCRFVLIAVRRPQPRNKEGPRVVKILRRWRTSMTDVGSVNGRYLLILGRMGLLIRCNQLRRIEY